MAPSEGDLAAVRSFLQQHGLVGEAVTPNSDFLRVHCSAAEAACAARAKSHMRRTVRLAQASASEMYTDR